MLRRSVCCVKLDLYFNLYSVCSSYIYSILLLDLSSQHPPAHSPMLSCCSLLSQLATDHLNTMENLYNDKLNLLCMVHRLQVGEYVTP